MLAATEPGRVPIWALYPRRRVPFQDSTRRAQLVDLDSPTMLRSGLRI